MSQSTRAWRWQQPGEPDTLIQSPLTLPDLQPGEVLIANRVIALNPVDWKLILRPPASWQPGQIPGVDGMGVVIATGSAATHIRIGARICYHTSLLAHGSFAEHTIVPAKALLTVPDNLGDEAAAAFPCPGLTAWQAMRKVPELSGKNVLVSGAGGSVGYYLTQLLLAAGARVQVTASPSRHALFLQSGALGAYDYRDPDWQRKLQDALHGRSLYAAFDMVNGQHATSLGSLIGYYGHLVSVQDRVEQPPQAAFTTCLSLHEIALGAIHQYGSDTQWAELISAGEHMLQSIARGEIRQTAIDLGTFDELPAKLAMLKAGKTPHKYLVHVTKN